MNVPNEMIDPKDQGEDGNTTPPEDNQKEESVNNDESQGSENGAQPSDDDAGDGSADKEADNEELYELPDGRKVTLETALHEWKDNFLPDYTQKATELKKLKGEAPDLNQNKDGSKVEHPWEDPDWVPGSYQELIKAASEASRLAAQAERDAEIQKQQQVKEVVDSQITEIRKTDKNLDEEALFKWANKYQFTDLRLAYANMVEVRNAKKSASAETAKNLNERTEGAPVNGSSAPPSGDTGIDFGRISSARSLSDAVQDHLSRLTRK